MTNLLRMGAALWLLPVTLCAQAGLGGTPPEPRWTRWLRGEPVAAKGERAPKVSVWAFYGQVSDLLLADADYLADLQRRFGRDGLVTVVSVGAPDVAGVDRCEGCRVVLDEGARTEQAWTVVNREHRSNVLVTDARGVVTFVGRPGSGLVDAIAHTLAGDVEVGIEAAAVAARLQVTDGFDDAVGEPTVERLRPLLAYAPRDGQLQGLCYLALATKVNDAAAAAKHRDRALAALAPESRPLAVFADLLLRGDPSPPLVAALRPPLDAAAKAAPKDPLVQLALLRAQVLAGDGRAAGRQAMRIRKLVTTTPGGCLDYATLLTRDENPAIWKDLASSSLDAAEELGCDARRLAAARYEVALRCAEDRAAAGRVLDTYLKDQEMRVGINNDAWYFMTQLDTMGRHDWFAVGLVERMLEQRDAMDYFEFDTAALAMFLVGRYADAVELQKVAIQKGGEGNREYDERLARYEARLLASPR